MSSIKHISNHLQSLQAGDTVVYPYTLENERLLYIVGGKADLMLQMHFKINSLGMLEAVSSSLELNEAGQLVPKLDEAPIEMTLEPSCYYALPQGSELFLHARETLTYSLIEAKASGLASFIETAQSPQGEKTQKSPPSTLADDTAISILTAPEAEQPVETEVVSQNRPEVEMPTATQLELQPEQPVKPPIPKDLQFEPKQKFFYYSVQNRANFIMLMIGIFVIGMIITAIMPNVLGFVCFWSALAFVGYASYFEYLDTRQQKPVIAIVDDGIVLHTRFYRDMPLLWSEIDAMNLVVRENIGGTDLMLDLILARPEAKINYLSPVLKWFFNELVKRGHQIQLPRIAFKKSDFDMEVEDLKGYLNLVKSQY